MENLLLFIFFNTKRIVKSQHQNICDLLVTWDFRPFFRIFSIPTATLTKGPPEELEELPVSVAGRKSSQGLGLSMNQEDNTLFFGPFTETSISSWNVVTNEQK